MALMSLKLWELKGAVAFLTVVITLQVLMSMLFAVFVVFRALGKDYEASVVAAGFTGITLGTTATAIVSMTAVTKQFATSLARASIGPTRSCTFPRSARSYSPQCLLFSSFARQ
jgi:sodium--glutamate symport carrier gltS